MEEVWKSIPGFEGYSASSDGRIRNKRGKVLRPARRADGYLNVSLTKEKKAASQFVHKLVAMAFLPNPEGHPEVHHKNGVRDDSRVDNLEWMSKANNRAQRQLRPNKEMNGNRNVVWQCDKETGEKLRMFHSLLDAAKAFGGSWSGAICNVVKGRNLTAYGYKWVLEGHREIENEIWKTLNADFVGGETNNMISSEGRIKNRFGIVREGYDHTSGYRRVCIGQKDYLVHRLVAQTFLPNFFGREVINHRDGNKKNNRLYNLEWSTPGQNTQHAHDTGLISTRRATTVFALTELNDTLRYNGYSKFSLII